MPAEGVEPPGDARRSPTDLDRRRSSSSSAEVIHSAGCWLGLSASPALALIRRLGGATGSRWNRARPVKGEGRGPEGACDPRSLCTHGPRHGGVPMSVVDERVRDLDHAVALGQALVHNLEQVVLGSEEALRRRRRRAVGGPSPH